MVECKNWLKDVRLTPARFDLKIAKKYANYAKFAARIDEFSGVVRALYPSRVLRGFDGRLAEWLYTGKWERSKEIGCIYPKGEEALGREIAVGIVEIELSRQAGTTQGTEPPYAICGEPFFKAAHGRIRLPLCRKHHQAYLNQKTLNRVNIFREREEEKRNSNRNSNALFSETGKEEKAEGMEPSPSGQFFADTADTSDKP